MWYKGLLLSRLRTYGRLVLFPGELSGRSWPVLGRPQQGDERSSVVVDLTARRTGNRIEVSGSIPIRFADWNIPNPSFGPVTTQDHGVLEFLLVFAHS